MKLIRDIVLVILLIVLGFFITIKMEDQETEELEAWEKMKEHAEKQ